MTKFKDQAMNGARRLTWMRIMQYDDLIVTTYAGTGAEGVRNGDRLEATFSAMWCVCLAPGEAGLFVGDYNNQLIRLVDLEGNVSTYAGSGQQGFADGPAHLAQFDRPSSLCVNPADELVVSDKSNHRIRVVSLSREVKTIAGDGTTGSLDGPALQAQFRSPAGILVTDIGILVADWFNHKIRLISGGMVSTFAGTGATGCTDGDRLAATFNQPVAIALDPNGNFVIADRNNHMLRKINRLGQVSHFSGSGQRGNTDGSSNEAKFAHPWAFQYAQSGDLLVCDEFNHAIRIVSETGEVSTYIGHAGNAGNQDGHLTSASLSYPASIAINSEGEVFIADRENRKIRRIIDPRWTSIGSSWRDFSFHNLFKTGLMTDAKLELSNFVTYHLHSAILQLNSAQDLLDPTVVAEIKQFDPSPQCMESLLKWIYGENLPPAMDFETLFQLSVLGKLCRLNQLQVQVRHQMIRALDNSEFHSLGQNLHNLQYAVSKNAWTEDILGFVGIALRKKRHELSSRLQELVAIMPATHEKFLDLLGLILGESNVEYVFKNQPLDGWANPNQTGSSSSSSLVLRNWMHRLFFHINCEIGPKKYCLFDSEKMTILETSKPLKNPKINPPLLNFPSSFDPSPDYTIIIEEEDFKVHSWVLCGRWTYFSDAISFAGLESSTRQLILPSGSFTPSLFNKFLLYLYCNIVDPICSREEALMILKNRHMYGWASLQTEESADGFSLLLSHCRSLILQKPTKENCVDQYICMDTYGGTAEKAKLVSFMKQLLSLANFEFPTNILSSLDTIRSIISSLPTSVATSNSTGNSSTTGSPLLLAPSSRD